MLIRFDKELKRQEIYAIGIELAQIMGRDRDNKGHIAYSWPDSEKEHVHTFKNPVLVTDAYRMGKLDNLTRDTLFELFRRYSYTTEYDGITLDFDQKKYQKLWGPNIDTLFFCRALSNNLKGSESKPFNEESKTVIEIGAGSGFISKYLLKNHKLGSVTLIDLNPNAMHCWKDNIHDHRAVFEIGDALEYIKEKRYDSILCNPPYIPRPSSAEYNAYEGIGLLEYLIRNAGKHLNDDGEIITNISSVCKKYIVKVCEESDVKTELFDEMEVPLKVLNVLHNIDWIKYLEKIGLEKDSKKGYDYWHKIQIYRIKPK